MPETALFLHGPFVRTSRLLLEGFLAFAAERGWQVKNLCPPKGADTDYLSRIAEAWNAVGIAIDCGAESAMPLPAPSLRVPVALIDLDPGKTRSAIGRGHRKEKGMLGFINADARSLVQTAADELLRQNFASYAYISSYYSRHWSRGRREEFERTVKAAGGTFCSFDGKRQESGDIPDMRRLGEWLGSLPKPCGILAANDRIAALALSAAMRYDINVPDTVSIIGIDNDEMLCENMYPPLSSVQPDFTYGGYLAGRIIDDFSTGRTKSPVFLSYGAKRFVQRLSTRRLRPDRPAVKKALDFIRRHAAEGISAADVLPLLGGSRRSAEKRFRAATGKSILEEIIDVRFERLIPLLEQSHVALSALAGQTGFSSDNQLQRRFKARFGMTLSAYRAASKPR